MSRVVRRVFVDQHLVVLNRLLVVVGDEQEVAAERPELLALGHAIEVLQRVLVALLHLRVLLERAVNDPHARVRTRQARIERDSLLERLQRIGLAAGVIQFLTASIRGHRTERGGGEGFGVGRSLPSGLRVSQRLADLGRQGSDCTEHLFLAASSRLCRAERLAVDRIDGFQRNLVASAACLDDAREHILDTLTTGDQTRRRFIERLAGILLGRYPQRLIAAVGGDERRALDRDRERLLERGVEQGVVDTVLEIGDQHRRRRRLHFRWGSPRQPPGAGHDPAQQNHRRNGMPSREPPRLRQQLSRLIQPVQIREEIVRRLVPCLGIGLQTTRDNSLDRSRNRCIDRTNWRWRLLDPRHQLRDGVPAGCAPETEQHVANNHPERVDVRALVDRLGSRLFWRHVVERADDGSGDGESAGKRGGTESRSVLGRGGTAFGLACRFRRCGPRNAEVHDHCWTVRLQHDVFRFQVTMNNPGLMRRDETGDDVFGNGEHLGHRELALLGQDAREAAAIEEGHRDVLDAVHFPEIMDADHIAVCDLARKQQLALEAAFQVLRRGGIGHHFGSDDLQRDRHTERVIPRLVDDPHASRAEDAQDAIPRAKLGTRRQWTGLVGRRPAAGRLRPRSDCFCG